jgi:hypothetical protein
MRRAITVLLPALALLLIAVACDDGGGGPGATASPALTETPQATPSATETPVITATDTPQTDATPSPSQSEPQLAIVPANPSEFLNQFDEVITSGETCEYDQESGLVDCGANGLYQLQDGIQAPDVVCRPMLVIDQPVGVNCQTQDPLQSIIYAIQESP